MKLTNDFHHTHVRINLRGKDYLSASQVKRARKTLCGIADCVCGGVAGERPAKQYDRQGDGACYLASNQEGEALLIPW